MTYPTTELGTWASLVPHEGISVEAMVDEALGEFGGNFDTAAICAEYRTAINAALPGRVTLAGNDFYGPALDEDRDWDGAPDLPDIARIVANVDFWAIAARHERTNPEARATAMRAEADRLLGLGQDERILPDLYERLIQPRPWHEQPD